MDFEGASIPFFLFGLEFWCKGRMQCYSEVMYYSIVTYWLDQLRILL